MKKETLTDIINEQNEQRERDIKTQAESLIRQIIHEQQTITECSQRIAEAREKLQKLESATIDPNAVLGQ